MEKRLEFEVLECVEKIWWKVGRLWSESLEEIQDRKCVCSVPTHEHCGNLLFFRFSSLN